MHRKPLARSAPGLPGILAGIAVLCLAVEAKAQQWPAGLAGTDWRLAYVQSTDDAIGARHPEDSGLYTMHLGADGSVEMTLNCNRAVGTWSAEPAGDGTSGRFEFGELAVTHALCPPPSMDEYLAAQVEFVRGFVLSDGWLYLSLFADGGILAWEPGPAAPVPAAPAARPAAGTGRRFDARFALR